ncbi:hypothetical protein [Streptomyces cinnamoneus]|uniref:hypothetical protein n=1 Tax=Streptomyces cinnamoneus TaxID=53446 RepID=UPI001865A228|nr:hypothetical protein [Streptomyces cinnamoneus]
MNDNVLFLNAGSPRKGHRALDALRRAHADGAVTLREGTVIARDAEGALDFPTPPTTPAPPRPSPWAASSAASWASSRGRSASSSASARRPDRRAARRPPGHRVERAWRCWPPRSRGSTVLMAEVREEDPAAVDEALAPLARCAATRPNGCGRGRAAIAAGRGDAHDAGGAGASGTPRGGAPGGTSDAAPGSTPGGG